MAHATEFKKKLTELIPHMLTAVTIAAVFTALFFLHSGERSRDAERNAIVQLGMMRDRIESAFISELGTAEKLAGIVARKPAITSSELDTLTYAMLPAGNSVTSVSAAPNAIVAWYYPRVSGQSLIGHDLLSNPERRRAVVDAIEKRTLVLSGPSESLEGGYSVYARHAVYVTEKSGERLWGLISVAVDFGAVMKKTALKDDTGTARYALSAPDYQNPAAKTVYWGRREIMGGKPIFLPVNLPGLDWELYALPSGGWRRPAPTDYLILVAGLVSCAAIILAGIFSKNDESPRSLDGTEATALLESVAGEIRTALAPVAGFLGIIESPGTSGSPNQPASRLSSQPQVQSTKDGTLEPARHSFRMLRRLSSDLREMIALERGEREPRTEEFDLRAIVMHVGASFADHAGQKNLRILTSVEAVIPDTLYGDPSTLERILHNILGESVAYTDDGEVTLSVILEDRVKNSVALRFIVRDTGSVPEPEGYAGIFDPFGAARGSPSRRFATTGLAMALSWAQVGLLGGQLECEPGGDRGFMLRFTLHFYIRNPASSGEVAEAGTIGGEIAAQPHQEKGHAESAALTAKNAVTGNGNVKSPSSPPTPPAATFASSATPTTTPNPPQAPEPRDEAPQPFSPVTPFAPRILLAEDGEVNREIIMRMLRSRNFSADIATDGRQALAACLRNEYDIVFMDCIMPVMDGYESTTRLRQLKGPGRPTVIGMTSSVMESDRERCFAAGMDDIISKPFTLDELEKTIRKHAEPD